MKRLVLLVLFVVLSMGCAIAETELNCVLLGEWHVGSILYGAPRFQTPVNIYDDCIECDGYRIEIDEEIGAQGSLSITNSDSKQSEKGRYIDLQNGSFLIYWEIEKDLYGYFIETDTEGDTVLCYEVDFTDDRALFFEDEMYVKSETYSDNRKKSQMEKIPYLCYENEFYMIEEDNYAAFNIVGISDEAAVFMGKETVAYNQGQPINIVLVFIRTSITRRLNDYF